MIPSKAAMTCAWVALLLITLASYLVAESAATTFAACTVVVVAAALKARLILDHFLGARWFPIPWRAYFTVWLMACSSILAASALLGT